MMKLELRSNVMQAKDPKILYIGHNLECTGSNFFDTGFAPFSTDANTDFKITLRMSSFTPDVAQAVILGCKYEGTLSGQQWPGIYVRVNGTTKLDVGGYSYYQPTIASVLNKNMYIWRTGGKWYAQIEGETQHSLSVRVATFNQNIVIGAGVQTNGTKFRYAKCTIDYVRIEKL
jgi:hypothetical protein